MLSLLVSACLALPAGPAASPPPCLPPEARGYYFARIWGPRSPFDLMTMDWYSKHLRAANEPSLSCGPSGSEETYRFTWLRTFHAPVVVRVAWSGDQGELVATVLDGAGGYEPGKIEKTVKRALTAAEWKALAAAIARTGLWKMALVDRSGGVGVDGAEWVVEGRHGDEYHLVTRWSPDRGAYRDLGLLFVRLSGLAVPKDDIY
jgi:hypothetical protein